jgi:ZU5 domain-containing protein
MTVRFRAVALTALSLATFAACSVDDTTAVVRPGGLAAPSQSAKSSDKAPKTKVKPLHRTAKFAVPLSATQTIGPSGGTLAIPAAGVTLTVPAGALLAPVKITMTALDGDAIAYEFAPHGLVFLKPLTLTQTLETTKEKGKKGDRSSDPVELGYFALPAQVNSVLTELEELRGGTETATTFSSSIWHFSGYMLGCGRGTR